MQKAKKHKETHRGGIAHQGNNGLVDIFGA